VSVFLFLFEAVDGLFADTQRQLISTFSPGRVPASFKQREAATGIVLSTTRTTAG
jgi:hypothetical protein